MNQADRTTEEEETPDLYPQGIKWYGDWVRAAFFLPRACHLPVQADLGKEQGADRYEFRVTTTGDWRSVTQWRKVQMTAGAIRRIRRELKIEAQEVEAQG